ncbi:hypothetical protein [Spiroplasma sp. AdecLV25b]|uniref:hypothetical protein n=1 Tax=Spiroplasma sp. AdecLV25b TaxID=3027162 RepID=UPI0027DFD73F|nr:hypothetical protein [Spiroplasma sp. AdecLV25b]
MNLKKLLMLVAGTVLVVPTTLSVVACNDPVQLKKIDSVITTKELQEIVVPSSDQSDKPSATEVLIAINTVDKISLTDKDVEITNITITGADIKGIGNYDGTTNVTFTTKVEKNLDALIKTKELGPITVPSSSTQPTDKDVLVAINSVNKDLNLTEQDVKITIKDDKNATVEGIGNFDGSTTVTFTTNVKQNIDKIITTKELKEIVVPSSDKSDKPSVAEVMDAINKVNSLSLTDKDVTIANITTTGADVAGIGKYDETTKVTFTTKVEKNIDALIKTKELGTVIGPSSSTQPTDKDVLVAINSVNKDLNLTEQDVKITIKDDKNATVVGIGNFDGSTTVTFTTSKEKVDIKTVIQNTVLGDIITTDSKPSVAEVMNAIDKVDKINLTNKDVEITNITITSADVAGIGKYDGTTNVTFTTVKQYSDSEIQDAIKNAITEENSLPLSIKKTENYNTAVQELTDIFKKDNDKLLSALLSKDMQKQFDVKKLGFYDQVYNTPKNADYVENGFFKYPKTNVKVYFYIAYNATGDSGIFIPIGLTITNK